MELKPCPNPNCKHDTKPRLIEGLNPDDLRWVYCPVCFVHGPTTSNADDAANAWNALPRTKDVVITLALVIDGTEYLINWQHIRQYTVCRIFYEPKGVRKIPGYNGLEGLAVCNPKDEWNAETGKRISLHRACGLDGDPRWRGANLRPLYDAYRKMMHEQTKEQTNE